MVLYELIQIALGNRDELSKILTSKEWGDVFFEAQLQAIAGIVYKGVEKLPQEQYPPKDLLFQWIGISEQISQRNAIMDMRSLELLSILKKIDCVRRYLKVKD